MAKLRKERGLVRFSPPSPPAKNNVPEDGTEESGPESEASLQSKVCRSGQSQPDQGEGARDKSRTDIGGTDDEAKGASDEHSTDSQLLGLYGRKGIFRERSTVVDCTNSVSTRFQRRLKRDDEPITTP